MRRPALIGLVVGLGCAGGDPTPTPEPATPPDELVLPDLTGLDMAREVETAMAIVLSADLRAPWSGHAQTLELVQEGCPDLYVGTIEDETFDLEVEEGGMAWLDRCRTAGGLGWSGGLGWWSEVSREGDATTEAGKTDVGARTLTGDGIVDDDAGVMLEFDGEGEDTVYLHEAPGYLNRSYSAQVAATVTGRLAQSNANFPEGWRQDLYLRYADGDVQTLEARGDLYFLGQSFDRFDSISLDITLTGALGAAPTACTKEPFGWIGLRDTSAYWYEVVFLPLPSDNDPDVDYSNPLSGCDGCGTLYVRGVEQGTVCPSFDALWGLLDFPALDDYLLHVR